MQLIGCLAGNDSMGLLVFESDLTISKAMNSVSIAKLCTKIEKINVVKAIAYLILRLSDHFNVKQKFTDIQASTLALDLTEIFGYETLEDVVMMLKLARQGKIGNTEYKLDGQTVLHKWVPEYLERKAIERENEHGKSKGELNGMSTFRWNKEDVEKFQVNTKMVSPTKLGQRMKAKWDVGQVPQVVLKERSEFLNEMFLNVKRMTTDQLKNYLLKSDMNRSNSKESIPFDPDIYEMVEKEIDLRCT